jgi:RepB DNA-primase from phage plasmid
MTEVERKKRGEKSAVIVKRMVREQFRAMSCDRFDLGIRRGADQMILREGEGAIEIEEAIKWLRHENGKGAHIYIRPAGTHSLSLIDDLTADSIERMKANGFEPAVVVETSSNNFQAWLDHGQVLEARMVRVRRSSSPSALVAIRRARTGGISDGSRDSPTQNPNDNCRQECGLSRGCGQPKGAFIRKPPSSLPTLRRMSRTAAKR